MVAAVVVDAFRHRLANTRLRVYTARRQYCQQEPVDTLRQRVFFAPKKYMRLLFAPAIGECHWRRYCLTAVALSRRILSLGWME